MSGTDTDRVVTSRPPESAVVHERTSVPVSAVPVRTLRVAVFGLRGFPDVQGGIERHCENLYPRLARHGVDVTVIARRRYQKAQPAPVAGMRFVRIGSIYSSGLEAFVHSALASLWCIVHRPDVVHVHAIGPGVCAPLLRLFGLRVVVTHHGFDYDRQKWGGLAKAILRTGESLAARFANRCIVISEGIRASLFQRFGVESTLIPNGVVVPAEMPAACADKLLERFGLPANRYLICVGRLVPEKRQNDLVEAWSRLTPAQRMGWRLAIVGGAEHRSAYEDELKQQIAAATDVVATGIQTGEVLSALWQRAGAFLIPSSHEGLPIVLLEAMSYGLPVLASDIAPNLEVGLPDACYVPLADLDAWATAIRETIAAAESAGGSGRSQANAPLRVAAFKARVASDYNWDHIAEQTLQVYARVSDGS